VSDDHSIWPFPEPGPDELQAQVAKLQAQLAEAVDLLRTTRVDTQRYFIPKDWPGREAFLSRIDAEGKPSFEWRCEGPDCGLMVAAVLDDPDAAVKTVLTGGKLRLRCPACQHEHVFVLQP
jgi:hypothetical protein